MAFLLFGKTGYQPVFLLLAILGILGIAMLIATKGWLPRSGRVVYSLAGIAIIALLWTADIPPDWFDGSWEGFGLSGFVLLWAFVSDRKFGRPLLIGMALTLIVFNFIAHL